MQPDASEASLTSILGWFIVSLAKASPTCRFAGWKSQIREVF